MGRRADDGGGPSVVSGRSGAVRGAEVAERVLLHWRVRCLLRQAPLRATTNSDSLALCAAMVWTLQHRAPPPGLLLTGRRWAESAANVPDASRALDCLAEVVTEIAEVAFPAFPRDSLPALFDRLAAESRSSVVGRVRRPGVDMLTGLPDRAALERDLDALVAAAKVGGAVDVAVAVVEPERPAKGSVRRPRRRPTPSEQGALQALAVALQHRLAGGARLYRLGTRRLAVTAGRWDTAAMGELMLRTSCSAAPSFVWGTASLHAVGQRAAEDPDALVVLAEADLHRRRRDLVHARAALAKQHQRRALGTVAAALVVLAGIALGLGTGGPGVPPSRSALRPPVSLSGPPRGATLPTPSGSSAAGPATSSRPAIGALVPPGAGSRTASQSQGAGLTGASNEGGGQQQPAPPTKPSPGQPSPSLPSLPAIPPPPSPGVPHPPSPSPPHPPLSAMAPPHPPVRTAGPPHPPLQVPVSAGHEGGASPGPLSWLPRPVEVAATA